MQELVPSIPDLVEYQIPTQLAGAESAQFVALLKHYYAWLTEAGQPTDFIHNILSYRDIDLTNDEFRQHITQSLLAMVPSFSVTDKTLLVKHISEFLRSKGSFDSFAFIMKAVYGEDIEMYWNADKLFRASDNEYTREAAVRVESQNPWTAIEGSLLIQEIPLATAKINRCVTMSMNGKTINHVELDDKSIKGQFVVGSNVKALKNTVDKNFLYIDTYHEARNFNASSHNITMRLSTPMTVPFENLVIKQLNSDFRAIVTSVYGQTNNDIILNTKDETGTFLTDQQVYFVSQLIEIETYTIADYEQGVVNPALVNVDIINSGAYYSVGDKVSFIDGSGAGAQAHVSEIIAGGVEEISVAKKGYGYSVGDELNVINMSTGDGCVAVVDTIDGINGVASTTLELNGYKIDDGGSGYAVGDILEVVGGVNVLGSTRARLTVASVDDAWAFKDITITASGYDYPKYTKIALVNGSTLAPIAGFAATPNLNGVNGIAGITITSYPTITSADLMVLANGYGASAYSVISGGAITGITLNTGGVNYVDPVIVIEGDGTKIAKGVANMDANGTITSITMIDGGAGYTVANIYIYERNGSGFVAGPVINNTTLGLGSVSTVTVTETGDYSTLPKCFSNEVKSVSGSGTGALVSLDFKLKTAVIENCGEFYHTATVVTDGVGEGATFKGYKKDGVIASFNITNGGTGYTWASVVVYGGVGVSAVPNIVGGVIDSITIFDGGVDYTSVSAVEILGDGVGATVDLTGVGNIIDGVLYHVTVENGGKNYYHGTTLSCTPQTGGAISATLIPVIVGGVISDVIIGAGGGQGYIDSDFNTFVLTAGTLGTIDATISGTGKVVDYDVIDGGRGYYSTSEITPLTLSVVGSGTGALLIPVLDANGRFVRVDVLDGGTGYAVSDTISIAGGGTPTISATLKPVIYEGRVIDVDVGVQGLGYKYGTSAIVLGDGIGAVVSAQVETGITEVNVVSQGTLYPNTATLVVTDLDEFGNPHSPTTVAELIPTIVDGKIVNAYIAKKGAGYINPQITVGGAGTGTGASVVAKAKRNVTGVSIDNGGSGYTYADIIIVGDGVDADLNTRVENLGSISALAVSVVGSGYTATPAVHVTDTSGYGAVSGVKVLNGGNYSTMPIFTLDTKYNNQDAIIATGTKFVGHSTSIGGVKSVQITDIGADYESQPKPIFKLIAQVKENAAFKVGEKVTIKNGNYQEPVLTTLLVLMEDDTSVQTEEGLDLEMDIISRRLEDGISGRVVHFDYDRNLIEIDGQSDYFVVVDHRGNIITDNIGNQLLDELSGSFKVGDVILGEKSKSSATITTINRAIGDAVLGGNGYYAYNFHEYMGMLNNAHSVIPDNEKFQEKSYVIKAGIAIDQYQKVLKDTVHPAGYMMFGDVATQTMLDTNLLNEIGYNQFLSTLYLLGIAISEYGSEWVEMDDLFGDFNKFKFSLPIEMVQDLTYWQTSKTFMKYVEVGADEILFENGEQIVLENDGVGLLLSRVLTLPEWNPSSPVLPYASLSNRYMTDWSVFNSGIIEQGAGINPEGMNELIKISDVSATMNSGARKTYTTTVGNRYTMDFFIKKNHTVNYFTRIKFGAASININQSTGAYHSVGMADVRIYDCIDYFWVCLRIVATTTSTIAEVQPAAGSTSDLTKTMTTIIGSAYLAEMSIKNAGATGEYLQPPVMKHIWNDGRYLPYMFRITDSEAEINIL